MVFNKVDAVYSKTILLAFRRRYKHAVCISAKTGEGLDELRTAIAGFVAAKRSRYRLRYPVTNGALDAQVRRVVRIIEERYRGTVAELVVEVEPAAIEALSGHEDLRVEPVEVSAEPAARSR